jgi:rhomboid protease GluP
MLRYTPPPPSEIQPPQPQPERRIAVRMPVTGPQVTYTLLAIIVLIFFYTFSLPVQQQNDFFNAWAKVNERIREGEYYRLFTSMFLHLNLMHIVFNGYALYVIGQDVEALFGHVRFAIIYLLGGLSGSLASFIFVSAPSLGASGAIFAIFGAEIVYFYQHRDLHGEMGRRHLNQLLILMVINLALGILSQTSSSFRIDIAGHIGGLIGGVVLAWFIGPHYKVQRDPNSESGLTVVDSNPVQRWAIPSVLYAVGLVIALMYAVRA